MYNQRIRLHGLDEVPRLPAQTVLDVVTRIQRRVDPTLAYPPAIGWRNLAVIGVGGTASESTIKGESASAG